MGDNFFDDVVSKNNNFNDLLSVWDCLCGDTPERYETAIGGDRRVLQKRDRLIGANQNLGLIPRLICLQQWLGCSQQKFFDNSLELYAASVGKDILDPSLPRTTNKPRMLRLTTQEAPGKLHGAFQEGITIWVNKKIRTLDSNVSLSMLDVERLFDDSYSGATAIEQFWRVVHEPEVMKQPLSNLFSEKHLDKNLAERTIRQLEELESLQSESNTPVFMNVVCSDAWCRASAFAHYLAEHYEEAEQEMPVLVLPLCRQGQSQVPQNIKHSYDVLDFPHLVNWLSNFYEHGNKYNLDSGDSSLYSKPISDEIHNIRIKMLTRPATIIFDGVSTSQQHRTPLERVIADDDVFWFLSRLTDVPISSISQRSLRDNYTKNRFVLITDSAIPDNYYRKTQIRLEQSDAVLLPRVNSKTRMICIGEMKLKNRNIIKKYLGSSPALGAIQSDSVFRLLDSIITVVKEGELALDSTIEPWYFSKPSADTHGESWLVQRCTSTLMESLNCLNPAYSTLLGLVSYTPDGLHPASVKRLAHRLYTLPPEQLELMPGIDPVSVCSNLEALLRLLRPILRQRGHDDFAGIDEIRLAMFSQSVAIKDGHLNSNVHAGSSVIQFRMPQIMRAIRTYMAQQDPEGFHLAHRLLAEEAVVQQTAALTHVDVNSSPTIRSWRRLFSVIYHGLQSLPIEQDERGFVCVSSNDFDPSKFSAHGGGHDYWVWLYFFWYRRILERPPAWNLSRAYGLDALKAELLECFDKPWRLWPKYLPQKNILEYAPGPTKGLFTPIHLTIDHVTNFIDQRRSLARARIALSQLPEANHAIHDIQTLIAIHADERSTIRPLNKDRLEHDSNVKWMMDELYERKVILAISKHVFDVALLTFDDSVNHIFAELLMDYCPAIYEEVSIHLSNKCEEHIRYLNSDSDVVWSTEISEYSIALVDRIIDGLRVNGWDVSEISSIVDILFRLGEKHGISAEISGCHTNVCLKHDTNVMEPPMGKQFFHRTSGLISAYVVFEFAEALRLQLFMRYPRSSDYFASGNSGRQMIRTALALERIYRRSRQNKVNGISVYGQRAVVSMKTLARHLFRYPRERASMTIIESALFRTLGHVGTEIENLKTSQRLLRHAEPVVLGLGRTTRVRLRLALERAKVNQAIARYLAKDNCGNPIEIERYLSLSKIDIDYLEQNHHTLPLWAELFQRQRKSWKSLADELKLL